MIDKGEQRINEWRGWKYYCRHNPQGPVEKAAHSISCGKMAISEIDDEDCVEGCNCIWDPSSSAYWRNYV